MRLHPPPRSHAFAEISSNTEKCRRLAGFFFGGSSPRAGGWRHTVVSGAPSLASKSRFLGNRDAVRETGSNVRRTMDQAPRTLGDAGDGAAAT